MGRGLHIKVPYLYIKGLKYVFDFFDFFVADNLIVSFFKYEMLDEYKVEHSIKCLQEFLDASHYVFCHLN